MGSQIGVHFELIGDPINGMVIYPAIDGEAIVEDLDSIKVLGASLTVVVGSRGRA